MAGRPSFQWYPGDWLRDIDLRSCSLGARGLWIDMLSLMHQSPRRGYLQHSNGKPMSAEQLARIAGCSTDEVSLYLRELEDAGVFCWSDDGMIYSRRMVRDERRRKQYRESKARTRKGGRDPPDKRGQSVDVHNVSTEFPNGSSSSPIPNSSESDIGGEIQDPSGNGRTAEAETDSDVVLFETPDGRWVTSLFEPVTVSMLKNTSLLLRWHRWAIERGAFQLSDSHDNRLNTVAAAERSLHRGKNPPALFTEIVGKELWHQVDQYTDRAVERLRELERE